MADEHKGFANAHYPGMRIDPNEGTQAMDARVRWRFESQVACLGEAAQRALHDSSVFIIGATPLGVAIGRRLMTYGIGRIGLFGDEPLAGAHGFAKQEAAAGSSETGDGTVLPTFARWAAAEMPWVRFERFRESSIDRSIQDMTRGFRFLVSAVGPREAGQAVSVARSEGQAVVAAQISGRAAWCAAIPNGGACENCLRVPELAATGSSGLYFPLLEFVAGWVSTILVEASYGALGGMPPSAFIESIDATRAPWARETSSVQKCAQCVQPK